MPISAFQRHVLTILKTSRNPESYVAGGTAIQRAADSVRYSSDIDFFHDSDEAVTSAFTADRKTLIDKHYNFELLISQPSFYRAVISKAQESLKLEWVRDTAFRFFPVIEDEDLGYRLHDVDLAINKCLTLANRTELRDVLDILDIDAKILSLTGCVWAACGKDPGFTPDLILEMIQRHANITPDLLAAESLARTVDPKELKNRFSKMLANAKSIIPNLDPKDMGCLYLDAEGNVLKKIDRLKQKDAIRHYGTVKGSWPRLIR